VQQPARGVAVADLQADDFREAQAGGGGGLQEPAVAGRGGGGEPAADRVGAEDGRQRLGLRAVGDNGNDRGPAPGGAVAEAQGGGRLVAARPGGALLPAVAWLRADVFRAELVGGVSAVAGEADDGSDVGAAGAGGVVAPAQVVDPPLA
jgi:hypothetical protein